MKSVINIKAGQFYRVKKGKIQLLMSFKIRQILDNTIMVVGSRLDGGMYLDCIPKDEIENFLMDYDLEE